MQRSKLFATLRAGVLCVLLAISTPAAAQQAVTVVPAVEMRDPSDPSGLTLQPVTTIKPGDQVVYSFDLSPSTTPITLTVTFDQRLAWFNVGSDGVCFGPDDSGVMTCRDPFFGADPNYRLTYVWVWLRAEHSTDGTPITVTATTADDQKTLTTPYEVSTMRLVYLPYLAR